MNITRTVVTAVTATALLVSGAAWARIGVTSVTSGDPLGQPPSEPERVLRVGIDLQANERVSTQANDRAHLVFLDGSSLSVGPNSAVSLDKYVYDPNRSGGELVMTASKGVFRFVGGSISKGSEVVIKTPSATIGIRGGIATFEVSASGATIAAFLYGNSLSVTNSSGTQTATRSGSEIRVAVGGAPSPPTVLSPKAAVVAQILEKPAPPASTPAAAAAAVQQAQLPLQQVRAATPQVVAPLVTTAVVTSAAVITALDSSSLDKINSKVAINDLDRDDHGRREGRGDHRQGKQTAQRAGISAGPAKIGSVVSVVNLNTRAQAVVARQAPKTIAAQPKRSSDR
ncbi:MAG: FecR domain-containing protein [Enhydrobacter sp.]